MTFGIQKATVSELVDRFAAVCTEQDNALLQDEISKFNRLYDQMADIAAELKARHGDQRRALLALFDNSNMQVRLQAARMAFAVAPEESRQMIEAIAASNWQPQAGDAAMSLRGLDSGEYIPN